MSHFHRHSCGSYGPVQYVAVPVGGDCGCSIPMVTVYELAVASGDPEAQAIVGSSQPVRLSLEYMVDEAAKKPAIKVTTGSGGATSEWEESSPPAGYQVRSDLLTVQPGTRVTLATTEAAARLRWCETFCC